MGIAHVTNFEKPAVSPFFCIFLELIEGSASEVRIVSISSPHLRDLGSFVLLSLF